MEPKRLEGAYGVVISSVVGLTVILACKVSEDKDRIMKGCCTYLLESICMLLTGERMLYPRESLSRKTEAQRPCQNISGRVYDRWNAA